jgi:hypothetical protein
MGCGCVVSLEAYVTAIQVLVTCSSFPGDFWGDSPRVQWLEQWDSSNKVVIIRVSGASLIYCKTGAIRRSLSVAALS